MRTGPAPAVACSPRGDRLDQVFALDAEVHGDRRRHEYRRIDAEDNADGQRQREVVQRGPAEDQHGQRHAQRGAVGDHGAADGGGDGRVDHLDRAHLAVPLEVLAHAVEDDHRLVHRVAEHRQDGRQHRQGELPAKDGKQADHQDHVVQVGDDRRHRELPLKAEGQVDHDPHHDDDQRHRAVVRQLRAHGRTDELHALQFGAGVLRLQRGHHLFGLLSRRVARLQRQPDQHVAAGAEVLHLELAPALAFDGAADLLQVGRL